MAFPIGAEVLVSISDPLARTHVRRALGSVLFRELGRWDLVSALHRGRPTALVVYDLTPGNGEAVERLQQIRRRDPALPFVLFPPPAREVAQLIADSGRLGLVHALLQTGKPDDVEALERILRRAYREAPASQALSAMQDVIQNVPLKMALFLAEVVRRVGPLEQRPPTVATVARCVAMSPRALERLWHGTGLPGPKQMIDWASLIVLTCSAAAAKQSVAVLARRRGIDARQLHRLRRRLMGGTWINPRVGPEQEFNGVIVAFVRRCSERRLYREAKLTRKTATGRGARGGRSAA